jgi:hypothetical protein
MDIEELKVVRTMITQEQIAKAIDANVVVYDQEAKSGDISHRLVLLMINVARNLGYGRCVRVHYPEDKKEWVDYEREQDGSTDHFWGFDFDFINTDLVDYYNKESCLYPKDKQQLLVTEHENGNFLVGAF